MSSCRVQEIQPTEARSVAREAVLTTSKGKYPMHSSTFEYLKPTDEQIEQMAIVREAARAYCDLLEQALPDGPDKTFIIRAHRANAMWANVAITRHPDGSPRQ
jgi:hypothetical protein